MNAEADLIAFGMDDQIAVPLRKQLIPGFDEAVDAGQRAGAIGVTISGSGSALVAITPEDQAEAVADAMADKLSALGNHAVALTPGVSTTGVATLE
jgi:homoserine kinase